MSKKFYNRKKVAEEAPRLAEMGGAKYKDKGHDGKEYEIDLASVENIGKLMQEQPGKIIIDEEGEGEFRVGGGSVSVWVEEGR